MALHIGIERILTSSLLSTEVRDEAPFVSSGLARPESAKEQSRAIVGGETHGELMSSI
jgi:hypothetical protein